MGADCHGFFIEHKVDWSDRWSWDATIDTDRDYTAFGVLAGVREPGLPHVSARGYPRDCSYQVSDHKEDAGCHTPSWLTTDEMVTAQAHYVEEIRGYAGDGGPAMPYRGLEVAIMVMRLVEERLTTPANPHPQVRAVFCFDS